MGKDSKSKQLAYLLRHDLEYKWDSFGWREVQDLVRAHGFTKKMLEEIVATDEKGRYEFSADGRKIRALQGHSIPGIFPDLELKEPPEILYHGTSSRFMDSIEKEGLKKMTRNYVQMSESLETAETVGKRHGGNLIVYKVKAKEAWNVGKKFYLSKNNVWMAECVEREWLERL